VYRKQQRCTWLAVATAVVLAATGSAATLPAAAHGGGGAGESGTATHQHLDSRYRHNRYYYDRGFAVQRPPAGGVAMVIGRDGERFYSQGGNWFRWRAGWYPFWGGAWVVVDAPVGVLVPSLPQHYTTVSSGATLYYYANETYYVWDAQRNGFEVVPPPDGFTARDTSAPRRAADSALRGGIFT
jgi:hypothetical protein